MKHNDAGWIPVNIKPRVYPTIVGLYLSQTVNYPLLSHDDTVFTSVASPIIPLPP